MKIKPTPTPTKGKVIREVPHPVASMGVILPIMILLLSVLISWRLYGNI